MDSYTSCYRKHPERTDRQSSFIIPVLAVTLIVGVYVASFLRAPTSQAAEPDNTDAKLEPVTGAVAAAPPSPDSLIQPDSTTIHTNLSGCGGARFPTTSPQFELDVVQLVNKIRRQHSLMPLKLVDSLSYSARFHATDMGTENYFSHISHDRIDGSLVESCSFGDRVSRYYSGSWSMAENIGAGYKTPQAVIEGWMASPGHRGNILDPEKWEIGVGYYSGSGSYDHYWVQDFGRRRNMYPAIIDGEATETESGDVLIHLYGDWQQVRLRTDDGTWSEWRPFSNPIAWQIWGEVGEHTVHVEMQQSGQTYISSDTIHLSNNISAAISGELPESLTFIYNPETDSFLPEVHTVQPLDDTSPATFWEASVTESWITVTPAQGDGNEVVKVWPTHHGTSAEQGFITLSIYDDTMSMLHEHTIEVTLRTLGNAIFLPAVTAKQ